MMSLKHLLHVKRLSAIALVASITISPWSGIVGSGANTASAAPVAHKDISGHWAENTLQEAVQNHWIKGYEDGTLRPDQDVTRAEITAMVNRIFEMKGSSETHFSLPDVPPANWAYSSIQKAVSAGYMKGYEDGTFRPSSPISRQEVAVIVAKLVSMDGASSGNLTFTDQSNIAAWSRSAISLTVDKNLIKGYEDGSFRPTKSVTRAEVITILHRALPLRAAHFDYSGVYGDAGVTQSYGDVKVSASGVTLQNLIIQGDLLLDQGIGEGDVYLRNVTVKGRTLVQGGGSNSVHLIDSTLNHVQVNKKGSMVRLVASGTTSVQNTELLGAAKIEETDLKGEGFTSVILNETLPRGTTVTLDGNFDKVQVDSAKVNLEVPAGSIQKLDISSNAEQSKLVLGKQATVRQLELQAKVEVVGHGVIERAVLGAQAKDTTFETAPKQTEGGTAAVPAVGGGGGGIGFVPNVPTPSPAGSTPTPPMDPTPGTPTPGTPTPGTSTPGTAHPTDWNVQAMITGTKKITVRFPEPMNRDLIQVSLSKELLAGSVPLVISSQTWDGASLTMTIELANTIMGGTYRLKLQTPERTKETALMAEAPRQSFKFLLDTAVLDANDPYVVTTKFRIHNQYGEDETAQYASRINFITSRGALIQQSNGTLTIRATTAPFEEGQHFSVLANFNNIVTNKELLVSLVEIPATNPSPNPTEAPINRQLKIKGVYHPDNKPLTIQNISESKLLFTLLDSEGNRLDLEAIKSRVLVTSNLEGTIGELTDISSISLEGEVWAALPLKPSSRQSTAYIFLVTMVDKLTASRDIIVVSVQDESRITEFNMILPEQAIAGQKHIIPYTVFNILGEPITNTTKLRASLLSNLVGIPYGSGSLSFNDNNELILDLTNVSIQEARYLYVNAAVSANSWIHFNKVLVLQPDASRNDPVYLGNHPVTTELRMEQPSFAVSREKVYIPFRAYDQFGNEMTNLASIQEGIVEAHYGGTSSISYVHNYVTSENYMVLSLPEIDQFVTQTSSLTIFTKGGRINSVPITIHPPARPSMITKIHLHTPAIAVGSNYCIFPEYITVVDQYGRDHSLSNWLYHGYKVRFVSNSGNIHFNSNSLQNQSYPCFEANSKGKALITAQLLDSSNMIVAGSEYNFFVNIVDESGIVDYGYSVTELVYASTNYSGHAGKIKVWGITAQGEIAAVNGHYFTLESPNGDLQIFGDLLVPTGTTGFNNGNTKETFLELRGITSSGSRTYTIPLTLSSETPRPDKLLLMPYTSVIHEMYEKVFMINHQHLSHYTTERIAREVVRVYDQYGVELVGIPPFTTILSNLPEGKHQLSELLPGDSFIITVVVGNLTESFKIYIN